MGLKDLFSSSGRAKNRLDKWTKTATSPYTQSAERYDAMQNLIKEGSDEALFRIFKRFTIVSTKSIEDEEEKSWAYRELAGLGAKVLPAAKRFCLESENVAWALRIIEDVADETQEWEILDALLEKHPPGYERDPAKKRQILTHLAEIDDPKVHELLAGYLEDHDEGVRYFCVEQLVDIAEEASKEPLVSRLTNPEEDSLRLRTRILDGLAELGWDVSEHKEAIAKVIGQEHALQGGKIVKR
ncbi:MAG: HEAT repeat domain-containing protein [Nannocystaceae bacterium]|nr:HEAT repeat domain-containing protein [bacterium]